MEQKNDFLEIIEHEVQTCILRFSPLDQRMARDLARSISERVQLRAGGDTYYVPHGRRGLRAKALEKLRDGYTPAAICREFGVSRRTLQRWETAKKRSNDC